MIFCSDFLLCSESKPYGDRREVIGSPHTLSGNRKEPYPIKNAQQSYGGHTINSRTPWYVRITTERYANDFNNLYDHPKGLRISYDFSPKIIIKTVRCPHDQRRGSVRRPYDANCDMSTGYGLAIFRNL